MNYEHLLPFAQTDRQQEALEALIHTATQPEAAAKLGITPRNLSQLLKRIRAAAAAQGVAPDADVNTEVPPGYRLRGTSTYYRKNNEGVMRPTGQWVKTERDREAQYQMMLDAVASITEEVIPFGVIEPAKISRQDHLLAGYPVGDYHIGMLSWAKETGGNWDMGIAEEMMAGSINYLVERTAPANQALVAFLGDYFHYDSLVPETPTSKNQLDSDTRPQKMVRAGLRVAIMVVRTALVRHGRVHVIVEIGNHDPFSAVWLAETLRELFKENENVEIDTSPAHFHYYRWGKTLIGTHHGHGLKMEQLPVTMAHDRPEDWGQTEHRYWWTGHIHHAKTATAITAQRDLVGCQVESFRILAPADAYIANKGFRPIRDMKAIVYDNELGEVDRHTFNPKLIERGYS